MTPITSEQAWLTALANRPKWIPALSHTVVLSPHPDDETLGSGGLLANLRQQGIDVTVIAVTDGEKAYDDIANLGQIRTQEQRHALQRLGINHDKIIRLKQPDGQLMDVETQLLKGILPFVDSKTQLIAPWTGDCHPDHEAVGRVAVNAARLTGAKLDFYFFWTWHYKTITAINQLPLFIYPLTDSIYALKQNALACYTSQLQHRGQQPILPEVLLAPAKRLFEVYCHYER